MPSKAPKPCAGSPICPELVTGGLYCPRHARLREQARGSAYDRGYDQAWQVTRARYLSERAPRNVVGDPVCESCGTADPYIHVDHIDGLGPKGPRGHDLDNLQALCGSCHASKTAAQTRP